MRRNWFLFVLISVGQLASASPGRPRAADDTTASPENIEAAAKLAAAASAEYEFRVGKDGDSKPLVQVREAKLKWSNPGVSDIQGNVFIWTRGTRPLVAGSFNRWFTRQAMQHEFVSLAEEPLSAKFHGDPVWATNEAGVKFVDVPDAGAPAADETPRLLQLKKLAKEFAGTAKYRNATDETELRLLPQPIHSYAALNEGVTSGGLFAFVRGTDPELLLLIEARGKDTTVRWQFAAARMTNMAELQVKFREKKVWEAGLLPWQDVSGSHRRPYTAFDFGKVPDFLKEAVEKAKP